MEGLTPSDLESDPRQLFVRRLTNKQIALQGISIYRIEGGRVTEIWWVTDTLGPLQQLGAIPQPELAGV